LLEKVSKMRGENTSTFLRRMALRGLAELGFLTKDEEKALGITNSQTPPHPRQT